MATGLTEYEELLLEFKPRPIRSARDHARALRQIDQIMKRGPHLTQAASKIVEVLATLIEDYESVELPTPRVSPAERLNHLMESRGLTKAILASATGIPRATITSVIAGRRQLSTSNVARLAAFFSVPAGDFIAQG